MAVGDTATAPATKPWLDGSDEAELDELRA
jgi:hypothetical protein